MGVTPLNMISAEDVGEIVNIILTNKATYLNKTLSICGDKLTVREMAAYLSRHLAPIHFKERQVCIYNVLLATSLSLQNIHFHHHLP